MKYIKKDPEHVVLEITGESHTICNILRKRLMAQDEVSAAAYDITQGGAMTFTLFYKKKAKLY